MNLIFEKFDELGTINAVLRDLVHHATQLPIRAHAGPNRGQLEWRRPNRQTLRNLLHHPIYAGAYTWGRRPIDPRRKVAGRPSTGRIVLPPEQAIVFLKDRCPAYITWRQYQANQQRMADNQARTQRRGAVREGSALLGGLLVCGRCGYRMMVQYDRSDPGKSPNLNRPRYVCSRHAVEYGGSLCQSLAGSMLDAFIVRQVLGVVEPAAVELSLAAAEDVQDADPPLGENFGEVQAGGDVLPCGEVVLDRLAVRGAAIQGHLPPVVGDVQRRLLDRHEPRCFHIVLA